MMTLDTLFESQNQIAEAIINRVGPKMADGGFTIESAQVRRINPPEVVITAMNEINASQRRIAAATNDGEAAKIKKVLMAEAEAAEKSLRGLGIAEMRNNIVEGWAQSVMDMAEHTTIPPDEITEFLIQILNQETLEAMSKGPNKKIIFTDKSNSSISQEILAALQSNMSIHKP